MALFAMRPSSFRDLRIQEFPKYQLVNVQQWMGLEAGSAITSAARVHQDSRGQCVEELDDFASTSVDFHVCYHASQLLFSSLFPQESFKQRFS